MDNSYNQNTSNGYELSGKIMLSAIIILFAVVVFLIVLHLYARWYLLRARRRQRATRIVFFADPNSPNPTSVTRGLDVSVLNSLPIFSYSNQTHPVSLECAVCLSEFEESEKGRLLPKCEHSFHVDCIDMWFGSHSSCPLCRSPVEPIIPKENESDVVLYVDENEDKPGSSTGMTSLGERRKGLDLVGVTIEVPNRRDWETESPASLGFKSPASRLKSLKRILSFNKKTPAASPSAGVGTSSGSGESSLSRVQTPR